MAIHHEIISEEWLERPLDCLLCQEAVLVPAIQSI